MYLLVYIFDESKEAVFSKLKDNIDKEDFERTKSNLIQCLKYDFVEINIFSESISLEFKENLVVLKTNIKYSQFLHNNEIISRIEEFEYRFRKILDHKTSFLRLDEFLIEKYEECELKNGNWFERKNALSNFLIWLKNQDNRYWKQLG